MQKIIYVEKRKAKKRKAHSATTKRRISESLTGKNLGGQVEINSNDGKQLRAAARHGDVFVHQGIIDWYRDLKDM